MARKSHVPLFPFHWFEKVKGGTVTIERKKINAHYAEGMYVYPQETEVFNPFAYLLEKKWPMSIQPTQDTLIMAENVWNMIKDNANSSILYPNISAGDGKTVDFFWGDETQQITMVICAEHDKDKIWLSVISHKEDQSVITLNMAHVKDILLPLLTEWGYI